jgi:hypothetical protein
MNRQAWLKGATRAALESLMAHADAIPADKRDWRPLGEGRSISSLLVGCAHMTDWGTKAIRTGEPGPMDDSAEAEWKELISKPHDYDDAAAMLRKAVDGLCEALDELSDGDCDTVHQFSPKWSMTTYVCASTGHWQMIYTLGQAAYIQTLLGDKEMYPMPSLTRDDLVGSDGRDYFVGAVEETLPMLICSYEATPDDKKHWRPEEKCRTMHEVTAECVQAFGWAVGAIKNRGMNTYDEEQSAADMEAITRIFAGGVAEAFTPAVEAWKETMGGMTQADLDTKVDMFMPGWQETLQSNAYYPVWNLIYHYGQVSYIQTLYGDQNMH